MTISDSLWNAWIMFNSQAEERNKCSENLVLPYVPMYQQFPKILLFKNSSGNLQGLLHGCRLLTSCSDVEAEGQSRNS